MVKASVRNPDTINAAPKNISGRSEYRPMIGPTAAPISAEPNSTSAPTLDDSARVTPIRLSTEASITLNEPIRQPTIMLCDRPAISPIHLALG